MRFIEQATRELRHALRALRQAPSFSITAVLVLALGIGMATAMWTVVDAVLLRPLPVAAPESLVLPRTLDPSGTDVGMTEDELHQVVAASRTISAAAGVAHQGAFTTSVTDGDRALSLKGAWVTGNFFTVLGTRPALGRFFTTAEESATSFNTPIVLSFDTWRRDFGGDSAAIGKSLGNPYTHLRSTIIGVAPPGVAFPAGVEYWTPLVYSILDVVARLKPGAAPGAARGEFLPIMRRLDSMRVANGTQGVRLARAEVRSFTDGVVGNVRPQLQILSAAVVVLLLIACVNVGNLMLLRVTARAGDTAVRRSLGANTIDVVRPMLWESALLAVGGGVLGLGCAIVLIRVLTESAPPEMPRLDVLRTSAIPAALAAVVTLAVLLIAATFPVVAAARTTLASPLRLDWRAGRHTSARRRARQWLVASQLALALILLACAGLLGRSLAHLTAAPLGYRPAHVAMLTIAKPVRPDSTMEEFIALYDRIEPGLRAVPGVDGVTPIVTTPFYGAHVFTGRWAAAGESDAQAAANPLTPFEVGGPDYFRVFGIPLLRGRGFLESDREDAPPVVVVSHSVAERFWPGQDPIGKRMKLVGDTGARVWHTVVGEVGDIRYRDLRVATPSVFAPWRQLFFQGVVAVRLTTPLAASLPALRRAVRSADGEATIARAESLDALIGEQLALPRLSTLLLSAFGLAALLLAAIGLYGTMATAVRERTHEFGIRAALGATPWRLCAGVLRQAAIIAACGGIAGLAGALVVSRALRSQLYELSPRDPIALLVSFGTLLVVALVAAYLPAWRATRVDPARALRGE